MASMSKKRFLNIKSSTGRGGRTSLETNSNPPTLTTSSTSKSQTNTDISAPVIVDDTWSFKHNDERITYQQYVKITEDHKKWVLEQEALQDLEEEPVKRKKKK